MKKLLLLLLAILCVGITNAQKLPGKDVPSIVKSALKSKFPNAKQVKWEQEKEHYEASFKLNKKNYSVLIATPGNILETEEEIKIENLPVKAKAYLAKNYAKQKIKEAAKITDHKGMITYEAEIGGKDIIFDLQGNFLREVNA